MLLIIDHLSNASIDGTVLLGGSMINYRALSEAISVVGPAQYFWGSESNHNPAQFGTYGPTAAVLAPIVAPNATGDAPSLVRAKQLVRDHSLFGQTSSGSWPNALVKAIAA